MLNATHSTKTKKGRLYAYDYYRCSTRKRYRGEACTNSNRPRTEELEGQVWEFVFSLLTDPDQMREDMERMVELERKNLRGDPEREAKVWLDKLDEANRKRSGFQDMAAEGLINFEELREKLAGLEEDRKVAEEELKALEAKRSRLEQLKHDKQRCSRRMLRWPRRASRRSRRMSGNGCTKFCDLRCWYQGAVRWRLASVSAGYGKAGHAFCER